MPLLEPYLREAGAGPGVVCIHSNASTSSQWRALMDRLATSHHVLAPDSLGAGKSPPWPTDRVVMLGDEVALLETVFAAAGNPFFLIGHSYGGAVALLAALARPERVRALVVYEPTMFSLLEAEAPGQAAANGIRSAAADAAADIDASNPAAAGERFIDYWMGAGTWRGMPKARQASIAASMGNIGQWSRVLFAEPTPLQAFRALQVPVLYLVGAESPASSRGVARLLTGVLPKVSVEELAGLGHMGPVTHSDIVNDRIVDFLARH